MKETGDTETIKRNEPEPKYIQVRGWAVEACKMICTAAVAISAMYVRIVIVESRVTEHEKNITSANTRIESARDALTVTVQKVSTLEIQQTLVSGEFRDSLKRIEDDVKELKSDFKNGKSRSP